MKRNLYSLVLALLIMSCEITTESQKPKIIPEPKQEIIYSPKEELVIIEDKDEGEDLQKPTLKDFSGIENYQYKNLSSLISKYGNFDFSKKERDYEFHRYNAAECRIFIQSNTNDKKIIQVTIFHLENNETYLNYSKDICQK